MQAVQSLFKGTINIPALSANLDPKYFPLAIQFSRPWVFASTLGNLLFAVPRDAPDREGRAEAALASVGLEGFGPRDPATLSGGQQARVALLRVLLSEPRATLLDEPFSRLDATRRAETRRLVFDALAEAGLPALLVTHDPADAEAAGGRVVALD